MSTNKPKPEPQGSIAERMYPHLKKQPQPAPKPDAVDRDPAMLAAFGLLPKEDE
jgi:hypothetical protein